MTNEERDLITQFVARVGGVASAGGFAGSVPSGGQQGAAPVDHDADALITDLFNRYPEARYRITQLAFVQEHALTNAQQQIAQMQQAMQQMRQAQQQQQAGGQPSPWGQPGQQQPQQSRGFFGSLFGGGAQPQGQPQQQYAQPQQQYAPQAQGGGMFQPQGTGFLGGALRTAAGVAGGVVAADALMGLFSGHEGGGGGGMFGNNTSGPGGGEYPAPVADSQWGGGNAGGADPYDQGGAMKDDPNSGVADNSGWQSVPDQTDNSGGWDQGSNDDSGSGWTDSSSDS